jgi:hypothetical protein
MAAERPGRANLILAGLIALAGGAYFVYAVRSGRADSAMLFVGLPVLLAAALTLMPGRSLHGRVFRATTVLLLLAAVALHEGAICVILAAPLVYAVAHGTTALLNLLTRTGRRRTYSLLPVPLLLLGSIEGTGGQLRIDPDQSVVVTRDVALTPEEVLAHLQRGPQPGPLRSVPLRLLGMPTPQLIAGDGLDPGDRWLFHYGGSAHGPGGHTIAQVLSRAPDRIEFGVVEDSAITARWFTWRHASLAWQPIDARHTRIRLTVSFRRRLDPVWYFGPLQQGLMHEGGGALLDMLGLT